MELRRGDLKGVIEFVETAWSLAGERPFSVETVHALNRLIPADRFGFTETNCARGEVLDYVGVDPDDGNGAEGFWEIAARHPLARHHKTTRDCSAVRLSDVISLRQLCRTRVYETWHQPLSIHGEMETWLPGSPTVNRAFYLARADSDFSPRDRAVLDLVRPHLGHIHAHTQLRRHVGTRDEGHDHRLTDREQEILDLVGCGLTNADVAERLWISPATVKKHLDNIYRKLGVSNRTSAVRSGARRA
jgi:DNA-binding CsgD family transcriptional regulator